MHACAAFSGESIKWRSYQTKIIIGGLMIGKCPQRLNKRFEINITLTGFSPTNACLYQKASAAMLTSRIKDKQK